MPDSTNNKIAARGTHILLADDDEVFRLTTSKILTSRGYQCRQAADAREALEAFKTDSFDLLIADINMPGNEDLSLLDYIHVHAPGVPIIVVTGTPSVDTAIKSVGLNVCNYLIKPFDIDIFLLEVEKAVQLSVLRHSIDNSMSNFLRVTHQLAELREQLTRSKPDLSGATSNFLTVLIGGIVDSLSTSVTAMNRIEEGAPVSYGNSRQKTSQDAEMLVTAIKETIDTLEKTKQSFKSKELGTLRKKLNVALQVIDSKEPAMPA